MSATDANEMNRILIVGSCGAGKSTFARRLSQAVRLEVLHLDRLYWQPQWVETPKEDWRERVAEIVKGEAWIIDGNYSGTLETRLAACDTVIFLDVPRLICLWRVMKRILMYRKGSRPDMAEGCEERFDWEFIKYVWNYPRDTKPRVEQKIVRHRAGKTIIYLRSQRDIEDFLALSTATHENAPQRVINASSAL